MRSPPKIVKLLAFTLLELICLCGITAVLITVGLPMLSNARASANKAKCVHNIRTVGAGILTWAAENNGRLPAYGNIANNTSQTPTWGMRAAGALGLDVNQKGQKTVFMCPEDKTYTTKQGSFMHKAHTGHNSYTINLEIMDWEQGVSGLGGAARGGSALSSIAHPAQTILVGEHHTENNVISWGAGNGKTWRPGYSNEYSIPKKDEKDDPAKRGYHQGRNNWCFVDGHVSTLSFKATIEPLNLWISTK